MSDPSQRMRDGLSPTLTFRGSYALLEPMATAHVDDLINAASDGELWNLHFTGVPTPDSMPNAVRQALESREVGDELPFVVRRLSDGQVVGSTRYYFINPEHRNLSIGYTWYAQSAQRTAINTECKLMLLRHAFETLGCISVQWHTHHENIRSQAAIQRLGAKLDGVLRNHKIMPDGHYRHTHCFSMLEDEWPTSKSLLLNRLAENAHPVGQ